MDSSYLRKDNKLSAINGNPPIKSARKAMMISNLPILSSRESTQKIVYFLNIIQVRFSKKNTPLPELGREK